MSNRKVTRIFKEEQDRGSLFYKKYEWSIGWHQPEINVLRDSLDEFKVEKAIANARYWERQRHINRWDLSSNRKINDENFVSKITKTVVKDVHDVRSMLVAHPECKRVLSVGYITVYTSDLALKDQLVEYGQKHSFVRERHANVIYPDDTIMLKNPKYQYRTYLRSRLVTDENVEILKNWLDAQQGEIVASPGLKNFILNRKKTYYYPTNYTTDYHYFDHNDMRYPTMLRMVLPVAIRKTVPIMAK